MADQYVFANFFATELLASVTASSTTLSIPPTAAAKLPAIGPGFVAQLILWDGTNPPEIVQCTANPQTGTLTVIRGQEGTSAFAWSAGTQLISGLTAAVVNAALAAYNSGQVLVANYLPLSGGTLTGPLVLSGPPTIALNPATKAYVDGLGTGPFLPLTGGTLSGNLAFGGGARLTGLLTPSVGTEPATKTYADAITAALNNFKSDVSGAPATTGSGTAYVLATASGDFTASLPDGARVAFRAHTTSTGNCTLSVDGQSASALRPLVGVETVPGSIEIGGIYTATYRLASNEWLWVGAKTSKYVVTGGTGAAYTLTTGLSTGTPAEGLEVEFITHTGNTGTCTLAVDGGAALPLRPYTGKDFIAGELAAGMTGRARFRGASSEWVVVNQRASLLASLADALIVSPQIGQSITWNGAQWVNSSPASSRGYIDGLILSNDAITPNTILDISAGICRSDDNTFDIKLNAFTKTTASFAAGTGLGGLDTGSVAVNTWYAVWAILNSSTGATDILFSTSFSAPTMPGSFDKKRYIGSFKTATGTTNILAFVQVGDEFLWGTMISTGSGAITDTVAHLVTLAGIPVGIKVIAFLRVVGTLGSSINVLITSPDESDQAPSTTLFNLSKGASYAMNIETSIRTNTSAQVRQRQDAATSSTVTYYVYGWRDSRGKNA